MRDASSARRRRCRWSGVDLEAMRRHGRSGSCGTAAASFGASFLLPSRVRRRAASSPQSSATRTQSAAKWPQRGLSSSCPKYDTAWRIPAVGNLLQSSAGWFGSSSRIAARAGKCRSNKPADAPRRPRRRLRAKRPARKWLSIAGTPASHSAGRHARGEAPVGDDFHVAVGHQYIDEYAVVEFACPRRGGRRTPRAARSRGVTPRPQLRRYRARSRSTKRISPRMARFDRADRRLRCPPATAVREPPPRAGARGEQVAQQAYRLHALTTSGRRRRRLRSRRHRRRIPPPPPPNPPPPTTAEAPSPPKPPPPAAAARRHRRRRVRTPPPSPSNQREQRSATPPR